MRSRLTGCEAREFPIDVPSSRASVSGGRRTVVAYRSRGRPMIRLRNLALSVVLVLLSACSSGPGPLEGTWQMDGLVPMTVTYRDGEEEALGMISRVSYKQEGQDVLVTYLDGMAEGNTLRITMTGPDSARTEMGTLRRVR
jgi:hypothetical protein